MKHHLLAYIGIVRREHVQGEAEPPQPAPRDGAVRETRKAGWLPLRFRLACGTRSRCLVNDHHRTTERHTPQPARVSLAERPGFLEIALSELWLDLSIRSRRSAEQHEQEERAEIVSSLHRHLPSPKASPKPSTRDRLAKERPTLCSTDILSMPHNVGDEPRRTRDWNSSGWIARSS